MARIGYLLHTGKDLVLVRVTSIPFFLSYTKIWKEKAERHAWLGVYVARLVLAKRH